MLHNARAMRALAAIAVLLAALPMASPVRADDGLTNAVAAAYFPRNVDTNLHAIAHARVAELAACECLEHDNMRPGTAEVIAFNAGMSNPAAHAVAQWSGSPAHDAILSNRSYGRIGCAETVAAGTHWFACVLAAGPLPAPPPPAPPVLLLPNTAMAAPDHGLAPALRRGPTPS
jgi:hypothetical protein